MSTYGTTLFIGFVLKKIAKNIFLLYFVNRAQINPAMQG
jgi:hypothetical protein